MCVKVSLVRTSTSPPRLTTAQSVALSRYAPMELVVRAEATKCRAPQHLVPAPCCLTGLRRPLANPPTLETGITAA